MNALVLLADASGGGQIEQIARTFGVDWPHLIAQIISFCIVCALLYRFAYRPVLAMLEERRQQIAQGLANAEKIKAELAQTEAQRQEDDGAGQRPGDQVDRGGPRRGRARPGAGNPEGHRRRRTDHGQGARGRRQDHERMLAELKREVGRLVVQTTAAVTGKILTPEDQRRLAEETARQLTA